MEKFWMVFMEWGRPPTKKHDTHDAAKEEAERLTRQEGNATYILEAMVRCSTSSPPVQWELL